MIEDNGKGSLSAAAMSEVFASLGPPKPLCRGVFTWRIWPTGGALQFLAPVEEPVLTLLGPYAKGIVQALKGARDGDFVLVVHPSDAAMIAASFTGEPAPASSMSFMGIPIRELERDPEWNGPRVDLASAWGTLKAVPHG